VNRVVIFLVPTGATARDIEAAMREEPASAGTSQAGFQMKVDSNEFSDAEDMPLWTWFLPNPRH
jgi:hypothetical protein